MRNKLINFWNNLDNDRKDVVISCILVVIIALTALPFIPAKEPGYFPLTVLISQFLVNLLLMSWNIKRKKNKTIMDKRSGKLFSAKNNKFLIVYFFIMFPGFVLTIISGLSLFAFIPLIISRAYLFINNLPLSAMNLFFLTANKVSNSSHEEIIRSIHDYQDEVRNSSSYRNTPGNNYYDSNRN